MADEGFLIHANDDFSVSKLAYDKTLHRNTTANRYRPQHSVSPQKLCLMLKVAPKITNKTLILTQS